MKKIAFLNFIILAVAITAPQKTKVIFFGDSITEAGVQSKPYTGYILQIDSLSKSENRGSEFEFAGAGIGGNKVYDLYLRMESDVLAKKPNVVLIYVGVNDVWHKKLMGTGTDADKFEKFYLAILKKLKDKNIKAVLCTPALLGEKTDGNNPADEDMNNYSNIIRRIAKTNKLSLVDLRQACLDYEKQKNTDNKDRGLLTNDGVHMNQAGNALLAKEMWAVLRRK